MYLLDANVLFDMQKPQPNSGVVAFLEATPASQLFLSSTTLSELSYGIHRLPQGKKQTQLLENLASLRQAFKGRVLPYSEGVAVRYGKLMATQEKRGLNDDVFDTMLIAQALVTRLSVVTRNEQHFEGRGIEVV